MYLKKIRKTETTKLQFPVIIYIKNIWKIDNFVNLLLSLACFLQDKDFTESLEKL